MVVPFWTYFKTWLFLCAFFFYINCITFFFFIWSAFLHKLYQFFCILLIFFHYQSYINFILYIDKLVLYHIHKLIFIFQKFGHFAKYFLKRYISLGNSNIRVDQILHLNKAFIRSRQFAKTFNFCMADSKYYTIMNIVQINTYYCNVSKEG